MIMHILLSPPTPVGSHSVTKWHNIGPFRKMLFARFKVKFYLRFKDHEISAINEPKIVIAAYDDVVNAVSVDMCVEVVEQSKD